MLSNMSKVQNHFLPGLLIGCCVGIVGCGALVYTGPIATRDRAFNNISTDLIRTTQQLEKCSVAFVNSHGGKLPKGTHVQGEVSGIIVVGFDQPGH